MGMDFHMACFAPSDWPGKGPTVCLGLPECELVLTVLGKNGVPSALVNRPNDNRDVWYWIKFACEMAQQEQAFIMFNCDTIEQLKGAISLLERLLPQYERIALERMYDPESRRKRDLS